MVLCVARPAAVAFLLQITVLHLYLRLGFYTYNITYHLLRIIRVLVVYR